MLDRINMTCSQCGSNDGFLSHVTSPYERLEAPAKYRDFYVCVGAFCLGCGREPVRWVQVQAIWNLLRSVSWNDKRANAALEGDGSLYPTQWKLWKMADAISPTMRRLRKSQVERALNICLPDFWAFSRRKSDGSLADSFIARDASRTECRAWLRDRFLQAEWQSLWVAILNAKTVYIGSPEITRVLRTAVVSL